MTSGASGSSTDLRIRHDHVQRALELYETVTRRKQGQVVFLAGSPGSGRAATLQSLAGRLRRAHPRPVLISGRFARGQYEPWTAERAVKVPLKEIMATIGKTMPLAARITSPLVGSVVTLIGQLLQGSVSAWELIDSLTRQRESLPDSLESLKILLRRAAQAQPLVCLIEDLDEAEGSWWSDLVLTFAPEIARDLCLLIFLTMEGPLELGQHELNEPDLLYVARRLVERGLAQWWPLRPLSADQIAAWLGAAEGDLVERLHGVTGGNPEWVMLLWEDWRKRGVVRQTGRPRRWRLIPGKEERLLSTVKDIFENRLKYLLVSDDPRSVDEAIYVLSCAALEGRHFTADAVARVVGWDRDKLIDFLDDNLVLSEERPEGILTEVGGITIGDRMTVPRRLWHYAFTSDLYWLTLNRYGLTFSERAQLSLHLARALAELYAPEQRRVARTLARLFRSGGDRETAIRYQRMADFTTAAEVLREQALYVTAAPRREWDNWDYLRATALLLEAGWKIWRTHASQDTLAIFEAASDMASRTGIRSDEASALRGRGCVHSDLGEYDLAVQLLEQALTLFRDTGDQRSEAVTLHKLASIDSSRGNFEAAREKWKKVLQMEQQIDYRHGEATTWNALGCLDLDEKNFEAAREKFLNALEIRQQTGDLDGMAITLQNLASIDAHEGDYAAAREKYNNALETQRQIDDRFGEAACWASLAMLDWHEGNHAAARDKSEQALEIYQQIDHRPGEAFIFRHLGFLAAHLGRTETGLQLYLLSTVLLQSIDHFAARRNQAMIERLASQLNCTQEQLNALRQQVAEAYERDRGWGLIEVGFAET